jgi:hypothetical protein
MASAAVRRVERRERRMALTEPGESDRALDPAVAERANALVRRALAALAEVL